MTNKRLRRFWPFLRPFTAQLALLFAATTGALLINLPMPWLEQIIIDDALAHHDVHRLWSLVTAIVALFAGMRLLVFVRRAVSVRVKQRVLTRVRMRMYDHLQRMSLEFFGRHPPGGLLSRLTNDVGYVQHLLSDEMFEVAGMGLKALVVVVLLFSISPRLTWLCAGTVPPIVVAFLVFKNRVYRRSRALQASQARLSSRIQENFAGMKLIQSACIEAPVREETLRASKDLEAVAIRREMVAISGNLTTTLLAYVPLLAILWGVGGTDVIRGTLSLGSLLAFTQYLMGLVTPVTRFFQFTMKLQTGYAALDRIFEILDEKPDIEDAPHARPLDAPIDRIEFDRVSLRFGPPEHPIVALDDVSFTLNRGERIALVGPTGGGKTSILHLLMRFHAPTAGQIRINGRPIEAYTLESLRKRFAYAPQDVFLFGTTVRHNVALYREIDDDALWRALSLAAARDFVSALPHGLDAPLDVSGANLSGGQKQRLALARVFLNDADLYLLDEATSALDARSEQKVLANLGTFLEGRTALLVAHRFAFLGLVDRVLVFNEGKLVESGTVPALLEKRGLFAALAAAQGVTSPGGE